MYDTSIMIIKRSILPSTIAKMKFQGLSKIAVVSKGCGGRGAAESAKLGKKRSSLLSPTKVAATT
jgi:hypothetical protein